MARVIHFEIAVDDPQASVEFYQNVFAWQITKWEGPMDYWLVKTGEDGEDGIDGALSHRESLGQPITMVIDVDDAAAFLAKVKANGGSIVSDVEEIPGEGIVGYFKDPAGNILGVMQSFA